MYSRYSGVSIPKNYSGSRFSTLSEPETKTHRAKDLGGASKSSRSPSFTQYTEQEQIELVDDEAVDVAPFEEPLAEETPPEQESDEDDKCEECQGKATDSGSFLKSILSALERDELILLGLIFLLISDHSQDNTDIIMILALLLVGG